MRAIPMTECECGLGMGEPQNLKTVAQLVIAPSSPRAVPTPPSAIPMTMKYDDGLYYLIGLRFETVAEAEDFANGLAAFSEGFTRNGERLFLNTAVAINRDERGNCSGFN